MEERTKKRRRRAAALLLPLLLLNITVSENDWYAYGIRLGQTSYWVIIAIAGYLAASGPYQRAGVLALGFGLGLRGVEAATGSALIEGLRHGALAALFIVAGASVYGREPERLQRQFVLYFALCLPVMLLQITGAHSIFQTWNIDYAHNLEILSLEEIGTFKMIPVYPTLFVDYRDIVYTIGQARPSGLTYANNVTSVLICIAMGVNFGMATHARLRLSDVVLIAVTVLTMSLTAVAAVVILCGVAVLVGARWRKAHALKSLAFMAFVVWGYAKVFPGLFTANVSESKLLGSVYTRGLQVFDALGISFLRERFEREGNFLDGVVESDAIYSGVAIILASPMLSAVIVAAPFAFIWYWRGLRQMQQVAPTIAAACLATALMCALTQFGVPYLGAPSFQVLCGFALLPLFPRMWRPQGQPPPQSAVQGVPP